MLFALLSLVALSPNANAKDESLMDMDMPCEAANVFFTSPSNLQTNVPLNVEPLVAMRTDCDAASQYEIRVLQNGEVIGSQTHPWQSGINLFDVAPSIDLQPNTTYEVQVEGVDWWGETTIISFTTGDQNEEALSGAPVGEINDAWITTEEGSDWGSAGVQYDLTPAEDPHDLSVLIVYNESNPNQIMDALRVGEDNISEIVTYWTVEAPFAEEHCLTVEQRSGSGFVTERSETFCRTAELKKDPFTETKCSVLTTGGVVGLTPLLAIAAIRRRRIPTATPNA